MYHDTLTRLITNSIYNICRQHVNFEMLTENENPFFLTDMSFVLKYSILMKVTG